MFFNTNIYFTEIVQTVYKNLNDIQVSICTTNDLFLVAGKKSRGFQGAEHI